MDTSVSLILVVLSVSLAAFFSATETAFASVNKIRLRNFVSMGNKRAQKALKVAENYDKALSAILIGSNIVNIAAASIGTVLFTDLFGPGGVGISTVVMTLVMLTFGEILPKTYAKDNAEQFSLRVACILLFLMKFLLPLITVFVGLKKLVSKPKQDAQPSMTEQELKYIIEDIEDEGVLEQSESELVQLALDFDEITVDKILTPRVDIVAADVTDSNDEIKRLFITERFSRIPVYEKSIDNIIGVIHEKDFFKEYLQNDCFDLRDIISEVPYVPPKKKIAILLKELQRTKSHLAVVADQYGGTAGIVTLEDILEQLVGEIWDEDDEVEYDIITIAQNTYHVAGDMNLFDFFDEIEYPCADFKSNSKTLGGWATEMLNRIPEVGDSFIYRDLDVRVTEVEDQRVQKLFIKHNVQQEKQDET